MCIRVLPSCWSPQLRSIVIRACPHTALPLITHSEWLDALALTNCLSSTLHTMWQRRMSGNRQMLMESEVDGLSANLKILEMRWRGGASHVVSANDQLTPCGFHGQWRERSPFIPVSLRKCSAVPFIKHTNPTNLTHVAVWVGHRLLPVRKALCFQTCPLTVDREVLNELKLDKIRLYHHGNTNHSSCSWHPLDFPEQWEQKYAPLNLPH